MDESFEDLLRKFNFNPDDFSKVQAMINSQEKCIAVRDDMNPRRKNWGYLHELAHYVLEWHRAIFEACPISALSPYIRKKLEREADQFAAELYFQGSGFIERAMDGKFGLEVVKSLADEVYDVSFQAAFSRYASENPENCSLLVWENKKEEAMLLEEPELTLKYTINSDSFSGPKTYNGTKMNPKSDVIKALRSGVLDDVLEHEVRLGRNSKSTYQANSFFNQYNVFTLIWQK